MICLKDNKEGADILIGYLERTLDAERTIALERHSQVCPDCRSMLGVWNTLDDFAAPDVPADFDKKLYARIAEDAKAPWWTAAWRRLVQPAGLGFGWKPAVSIGAACAVLAFALMIRSPQVDEPANKAQIQPLNMEQVEQGLEDLDLLAPLAPQAEAL